MRHAVYLFSDYDGEPIYVGQTVRGVSDRIGRHLTGQRSDAVAKFVLDPFEVLDIEVWPFPDLMPADARDTIDRAEYTVFRHAVKASAHGAILNEGAIQRRQTIRLPRSYRHRIVPEDIFALRRHPDIRIARRSSTIASLARVISEREPSVALRQTLLTQARRLQTLADRRLATFGAEHVEDAEQLAREATAAIEEP